VEHLVSAEIERVALGDFTAIATGLLGSARHESGENLSKSEELDGCEEAEGAEHCRYEDTAEEPASSRNRARCPSSEFLGQEAA
jgi:hypothetical protein